MQTQGRILRDQQEVRILDIMDFKEARDSLKEKIREINRNNTQKIQERILVSNVPSLKVEEIHSFERPIKEDDFRIEDYKRYEDLLADTIQESTKDKNIVKKDSYVSYQSYELGLYFIVNLTESREETFNEKYLRVVSDFRRSDEKVVSLEDIDFKVTDNSVTLSLDELSYKYESIHPKFQEKMLELSDRSAECKIDFLLSIRSYLTQK